jgi:dihydrofolate reductase
VLDTRTRVVESWIVYFTIEDRLMRRLILQEFVTIDGLAAGPNGSVDFVPASNKGDRAFGRDQLAFIDTIDRILLGRVTYQMFSGHWPNITEGDEKPFADRINAIPKIVFSKTLDRAPWGTWNNATIVRGTPAEEVTRLKQEAGKDIVVWGSLSLTQALIDADLIDEYRLVVCPVVLGDGRSLFRDTSHVLDMHLVGATSYDRGAVQLTYAPDKARATEATSLAGAASTR